MIVMVVSAVRTIGISVGNCPGKPDSSPFGMTELFDGRFDAPGLLDTRWNL